MADQRTRVERHPGNECGTQAAATCREQVLSRPLLEHVEYHLDGVHETKRGKVDAFIRSVVTNRDADLVDLALNAQLVQRLEPVQRADTISEPAVQLEKVDTLETEPAQRLLDGIA